ncbi:MAG: winged helix-turn-helix transcriptional regulator [Candidatus Lokiarchaeota archaeon]|nr:winged helix-turn-helix transcriptional regulator [Candidatus Lokiarchaeota archaeon]
MDEIDLTIILLLMNNSRLTYREISDHLGLSVNAIYKRIQTLIDLGTIEKFTARLKPYAINAIYAFFFGQSNSQNIDKAVADLGEHENTCQIIRSSRNYIYIGAMLEDIHQLDDYSSFVSKTAEIQSPKMGLLSGVNYTAPIPYIVPQTRTSHYDKFDLEIIRALNKDSRKPISEIAEDINSTPNTVRRRLTRMIQEGIIDLSINFNPVGSNDIFAVFQLTISPTVEKNEFSKYLNKKYHPHLFYCWTFSNLPNLIHCWVWTNTMNELNELIENVKKEKIDSLVFDIMYKVNYFDTWKESILYE